MREGKKRRKYGNEPVELDGLKFDSKAEARRWAELVILQRAGDIHSLEHHPRYELCVDGFLVSTYEADFRYYDKKRGEYIAEDVKGSEATQTKEFKIKKRLVWALYKTDIKIIGG